MTDITCSCDTPVTQIAIDIAKKCHDAKIKRPDGRIVYLRFENSLAGYKGIGPKTATSVVAAIGKGTEFKNGRHFAAWLGLVP